MPPKIKAIQSTESAKPEAKTGFAQALEDWYHQTARDLPWRHTRDAYHIWLSEIMLQQTQVATVIPYYEKFLKQFPTVHDLAKADEGVVLKAWEGLGYYARCRNLHKAAKVVSTEHGGQFPDTLEGMASLPGIGQSTAGAILTFAKGQRHPLLDGNVKRVLSRLYNVSENVATSATQKKMWAQSTILLDGSSDPFTFNQAIMELGATLCTPKNPQCLICPVGTFCDAVKAGTQHERPVKAAKKATPHHHIGAAVIWNTNGEILIQQRPKEGLLGGLWEFPGGKQEPNETLEETVHREISEELSIQLKLFNKVAEVKHAYSHFKITLHAYNALLISGTPKPTAADDWQWVHPEQLRDFAFPKANIKVIDAVLSAPVPDFTSQQALL